MAVEDARRIIKAEGLRLTPVRERVLEILADSHRALGAYEVLELLVQEGHPRQPPVAYRALDFLCENGLAHRIARLNAFTACRDPGREHTPSFLICRTCENVAETASPVLDRAIEKLAGAKGFIPEPAGIEAMGLCPACADQPAR